jgi:hypothetical protein
MSLSLLSLPLPLLSLPLPPTPMFSFLRQPTFSLLAAYCFPNKLYYYFYRIFLSCLSSSPARCKNRGNFQGQFFGNIFGTMTQIPYLTYVNSRVYNHILMAILTDFCAPPLFLPLSQTTGQTWILKGGMSSSMATYRKQGPETSDLWLHPMPAGSSYWQNYDCFFFKDFRVSSPWVEHDR